MPVIEITTTIAAPISICFDLARDIDFHVRSMSHTGERAVEGTTSGLIELGESVTWEGRHLFVRQRFTSRITAFDRPYYFRDEMTAGAFHHFAHDHRFEPSASDTVMTDVIEFQSPYGPLGWLVDRWFLTSYLRRLIEARCQAIRHQAEASPTGMSQQNRRWS